MHWRIALVLGRLMPAIGLVSSCAPPPAELGRDAAREAVAWIQLAPASSGRSARVLIGPAERCPDVSIGDRTEAMRARPTSLDGIYGKVCEARVPATPGVTVRIVYPGRPPLLEQIVIDAPQRIAVLGDTGCRVAYYADQGCGDADSWPFARIARSAATAKPDLVLHLGDYFYREAPCKASAVPCIAGLFGDREETWRADFLTPARDLLRQAPWVFSRGNHEDCERGGYGWYHYFGDGKQPCEVSHQTSILTFANLTLVSFDSAQAGNKFVAKEVNARWRQTTEDIERGLAGSGPIFLLTHRPAYALCDAHGPPRSPWPSGCDANSIASMAGVRSIIDAARATGRRTIAFAGHVHTFQVLDIDARAAQSITQVIVGNSGTLRDDDFSAIAGPAEVVAVAYADRIGRAQVWPEFGFGVIDATDTAGVRLVTHDVKGVPRLACDLAPARPGGPRCK